MPKPPPPSAELGLAVVKVYGQVLTGDWTFSTGQPVTFTFVRNPQKAPDMGARYGQDLEPAGVYIMAYQPEWGAVPHGFVTGTATLHAPLVLYLTTHPRGELDYRDPRSWKQRL